MGKKTKEEDQSIDMDGFYQLLKRAYVGGMIADAALVVEDGVGTIQAFDMSTVLFVESTEGNIPLPDGEYGFGDMGIITNFVKGNLTSPMTISLKKNRMNIVIKGHGKLQYLLTEPQAIGSRPDPEDEQQPSAEEIVNIMKHTVTLDGIIIADVLKYIDLTKPRSVTISTTKKGHVNLNAGRESEHKFSVKLGKIIGKKKISFEGSLLTDHFVAVMKTLTWEGEPPEMLLKEEEDNIAIKQDDANVWVIQAVTKEEDFNFEE